MFTSHSLPHREGKQMITTKLQIGSKKSGDKFAISVSVNLPTNRAEIASLGNSEDFETACHNRGYRIRLQEQSGAREYVSNLSAKERADVPAVTTKATEIITAYIADPAKANRQSGAPKISEVAVDSAALSMKPAQLAALKEQLAAQGITLNLK